MQLTLHTITLPLKHRFTISRDSRVSQDAVIVALSENGLTGYGEVTTSQWYAQTLESILAGIERVRDFLEHTACGPPDRIWSQLEGQLHGQRFAQCALDMAVHDLYGRLQARSLVDLWGLNRHAIPDSSFTIGIDTINCMIGKLREQPGWSCYKIKLGVRDDLDIVRALRQETTATFRVDANCAWTATETVDKSHQLRDLGVEFIEQPLPPTASAADQQLVFERSALPIIADESCLEESDVDRCQGRFHGVNVKLCKCGGLTPALRMLRRARGLGMKTMVGCMVESSIGISAAAQLLPLLDYADLDGAVLLRDEPARGVRIDQGHVTLSALPGTGAELLSDRLHEFAIR